MQEHLSEEPLLPEDFDACGWQRVVESNVSGDLSDLWRAFSQASRIAGEEGRAKDSRMLWLLASVCSLHLVRSRTNSPFRPALVLMDGERSAIPDDLTSEEIAFLEGIVGKFEDPALRARIFDLLWLIRRPRRPEHGLGALDAYLKLPLDSSLKSWDRAIGLARMLRDKAGDTLEKIERDVVSRIGQCVPSDRFLAIRLGDLLRENGLGRTHCAPIAEKLANLAESFRDSGELFAFRAYCEASGKWYEDLGDEARAAEMLVKEAEGWVEEAQARISGEKPSHLAAASNIEKAIQIYRKIPSVQRKAHRVEQRLSELRQRLADSSAKSLDELKQVSAPEFDVSEIVSNAIKSVQGKDALNALRGLVGLSSGPVSARLHRRAEELLRAHPLSAMLDHAVLGPGGRVVARRPGVILGTQRSEATEQVIWAEMIRDFNLTAVIVVSAQVLPALRAITAEHRLNVEDFISIARGSPFIPPGHEVVFGTALYMGYEEEWAPAIHLLAPQIEGVVRYHLAAVGATVTTLDGSGIETEFGLGTLMDLPEAERVLGEDLVFELKAIFCDPFGPNLRNRVAHGLHADSQIYSPYVVYAWWLALRVTFLSWWNGEYARTHGAVGGEGSGVEVEEAARQVPGASGAEGD